MSSEEMVYVKLETDKNVYTPGEKVRITFSLVNDQPGNISLSSLAYSLEITGPQGVVLIVTESRVGTEPVSVDASSQAMVGTYVWDQKDMNHRQVPNGVYTVRVSLLNAPYKGVATIKIE